VETIVTGCPKNDIKITLGDFNAKVGLGDQDGLAVGNFGISEESDDNEIKIKWIGSALNMVIEGTTFCH
jgi:hypothetical protein